MGETTDVGDVYEIVSDLSVRQAPPEDVAALIRFEEGGNGNSDVCNYLEGIPEGPAVLPWPLGADKTELGWPFDVCGFGLKEPAVDMYIDAPDGTSVYHATMERSEYDDNHFHYIFQYDDSHGSGEYTIRVIDGGTEIQSTINIVPVTRPRFFIDVQDPHHAEFEPGEPLTLMALGVEPGANVEIALYESVRGVYRFTRFLPEMRIDPTGHGELKLSTTKTDSGCWGFSIDPRAQIFEDSIGSVGWDEDNVDVYYGLLLFCL